VTLEVQRDGSVVAKSQLTDYQHRGDELESLSLYEFIRDTYDAQITAADKDRFSLDVEPEPHADQQRRGRPLAARYQYTEGHPRRKTRMRRVRDGAHNTLPNIVGGYFARESNPAELEMFQASMMALLKPWRVQHDLRSNGATWAQEFDNWESVAGATSRQVLDNVRFCQQSQDAARDEQAEQANGNNTATERPLNRTTRTLDAMDDGQEDDEGEISFQIDEDDIANERERQRSTAGEKHADAALEIACNAKILPPPGLDWNTTTPVAGRAVGSQIEQLQRWQTALSADQEAQGELAAREPEAMEDQGQG